MCRSAAVGIVAVPQNEVVKVIKLPAVKERMASLGYEPVGSTPADCSAQIAREITKWAKVIKDAGIKSQ